MSNLQQSNRQNNLGAYVLIGLGVFFFLGQILNIDLGDFFGWLFDFSWPFWIILPGAFMLLVAFFGGKKSAPMAIPGAVVTGTGLILLMQENLNYYESWAYLWALYPVFVGSAIMFMGSRNNHDQTFKNGQKVAQIGLVLLVVFGAFFELLIFDRFGISFSHLFPLLLIGGGVLLLFRDRLLPTPSSDAKPKNDFATNGKPKNDYNPAQVNPSLQRKIDEAIAEDDK
jgi:hypothetical protein